MYKVALEKEERDQKERAQQRAKAEAKESQYPEWSGAGLQEGKIKCFILSLPLLAASTMPMDGYSWER